ncbi:SMI1/KNR4 family protein [Halomonas organivorans]|uniref:RhsPI domain-containing protein n=1 Tax=Halomonas organivorans TaxID=257772 RepID=A0A7W5BVE0_9GAMM|nr:SMI1/KNR4 family protein [Halomonas organivorans]MBB3139852.1 hypothetical protein [Halomonas organivorans]
MDELSSLEGKSFQTRLFDSLEKAIPDSNLEIMEVFSIEKLEIIWENFHLYTSQSGIAPVAEFYGNMVLCLGCESKNLGKVCYFDFDFGCIELSDSLSEFSKSVQES